MRRFFLYVLFFFRAEAGARSERVQAVLGDVVDDGIGHEVPNGQGLGEHLPEEGERREKKKKISRPTRTTTRAAEGLTERQTN